MSSKDGSPCATSCKAQPARPVEQVEKVTSGPRRYRNAVTVTGVLPISQYLVVGRLEVSLNCYCMAQLLQKPPPAAACCCLPWQRPTSAALHGHAMWCAQGKYHHQCDTLQSAHSQGCEIRVPMRLGMTTTLTKFHSSSNSMHALGPWASFAFLQVSFVLLLREVTSEAASSTGIVYLLLLMVGQPNDRPGAPRSSN